MAEIEIGPLGDRLGDEELAELTAKLEKLGAPRLPKEDENAAGAATTVDGRTLEELRDRLEAYDLACEVYLPMDFDGTVEVGDHRFGSCAVLVEVLEELKEDLGDEDDEDGDDDEDDEDDEDDDSDEEEDEDYAEVRALEAKLRRLWKVLYDGAQAALDKRLPLYVVGD
jgi:hypothetical protein